MSINSFELFLNFFNFIQLWLDFLVVSPSLPPHSGCSSKKVISGTPFLWKLSFRSTCHLVLSRCSKWGMFLTAKGYVNIIVSVAEFVGFWAAKESFSSKFHFKTFEVNITLFPLFFTMNLSHPIYHCKQLRFWWSRIR